MECSSRMDLGISRSTIQRRYRRWFAIPLLASLGLPLLGCGEKQAPVPTKEQAAEQPPIEAPTGPEKSERSELPN